MLVRRSFERLGSNPSVELTALPGGSDSVGQRNPRVPLVRLKSDPLILSKLVSDLLPDLHRPLRKALHIARGRELLTHAFEVFRPPVENRSRSTYVIRFNDFVVKACRRRI